jgi:hypothetical protein
MSLMVAAIVRRLVIMTATSAQVAHFGQARLPLPTAIAQSNAGTMREFPRFD